MKVGTVPFGGGTPSPSPYTHPPTRGPCRHPHRRRVQGNSAGGHRSTSKIPGVTRLQVVGPTPGRVDMVLCGHWLRGGAFWTATTEGTATTAWIKGLRVLSLPSVCKKVRAVSSAMVRGRVVIGRVFCLVPCKGRFCSAGEALPHRRPHAAGCTLTRPMLAPTGKGFNAMGRAVIGQSRRSQALPGSRLQGQRRAGVAYSRTGGRCRG